MVKTIIILLLLLVTTAEAQVPSVLDRFRTGTHAAQTGLGNVLSAAGSAVKTEVKETIRCAGGLVSTPKACAEIMKRGCACLMTQPTNLGTRELTADAATRALAAIGQACASGGCNSGRILASRATISAEEIKAASRADYSKFERVWVGKQIDALAKGMRGNIPPLPKEPSIMASLPHGVKLLELRRGVPDSGTVIRSLRKAKEGSDWVKMMTSTPQGGVPTSSAAILLECPECGAVTLTTASQAAGRIYRTTSVLSSGSTVSNGSLTVKRIGDGLFLGKMRDHAAVLGRPVANKLIP